MEFTKVKAGQYITYTEAYSVFIERVNSHRWVYQAYDRQTLQKAGQKQHYASLGLIKAQVASW